MNALEQKQAAKRFIENWKNRPGDEEQESRSFWIELISDVLGVPHPTSLLDFERKVQGRRIDVFFEDRSILIEQKSRGVSLDEATQRSKKAGFETPYQQACWYAGRLPYSIRPRYIITCNFDIFRIYDQESDNVGEYVEFTLDELADQLYLFNFFTDNSNSRLEKEKQLSIEAGQIVANLYDELQGQYKNLKDDPREQYSLNVLIVRLVFLMYAEDSGLLQQRDAFLSYLKKYDASEMRQALISLFDVLNTPDGTGRTQDERDPYLSDTLNAFPYVNGGLFADTSIIIPQFDEQARNELIINASQAFDWSGISPTIFGAAFESTLNPETRRSGGIHYTSIENIHKVIDPLFLDDLKAELESIEAEKVERTRTGKLHQFQQKLASLSWLDPACGSGNFLTETYISIRKLENRVLENLFGGQATLGFAEADLNPIKVQINQFYGIEINDFAVSVAKTALWIAEQQMMQETEEITHQFYDFLPLRSNPNIVEGNALRINWNDVLPTKKCNYIMGNPPFIGARNQTAEQKDDLLRVYHNSKNAGNIDFVSGWFIKAAEYIIQSSTKCAFVSTNSICQGEQVANVWEPISKLGITINFAYDTFRWKNEANDQAHVFVIIVGFSKENRVLSLFHHITPDAEPSRLNPNNINFYLSAGPSNFIWNRSKPVCNVNKLGIGSQPIDNGEFIFTPDEMKTFIERVPVSAQHFHRFVGSNEFLNNIFRYVLWLGDMQISEIEQIPELNELIQRVKSYRASSKRAQTRKAADKPNHFGTELISQSDSIIIPRVSSERRAYIPIGFVSRNIFCSDAAQLIPNAKLYHFGILTSQFHNAWMRVVAGRLESRYRYSGGVVYNNFIWPGVTRGSIALPVEECISPDIRAQIEQCAQAVLDARASYEGKSLADLYDPDNMPADLLEAHKALDAAVEEAYGVNFNGDEEKIVAHLFKLYAEITEANK